MSECRKTLRGACENCVELYTVSGLFLPIEKKPRSVNIEAEEGVKYSMPMQLLMKAGGVGGVIDTRQSTQVRVHK